MKNCTYCVYCKKTPRNGNVGRQLSDEQLFMVGTAGVEGNAIVSSSVDGICLECYSYIKKELLLDSLLSSSFVDFSKEVIIV